MLSHRAYTSHNVVHINALSSSLGDLKTCLCVGTTKIKHYHRKLASLLKAKTQYNAMLPICVPSNWLDNTLPYKTATSKMHAVNSLESNQSYTSMELPLFNKHHMISVGSWLSPFYCQLILPKRKSFVPCMQYRQNHTYANSKYILYLEEIANREINNPQAQAEYLKSIVNEDPDYVIKRCESGRYADSEDINDIYAKALLLTNRLSISEVGRKLAGNKSSTNNNDNPSGTEARPLHVVMSDKKSSGQRFWHFVRFGISVGIGLYLITRMPSKMLNLSQNEVVPDESEKKFKFDDVQGCDEAKEELQEVVQFLQNPEKFERLGAKLPGGVLLIGPPGTGKTLLARAIAGEADVPFFFVSGSEFDEMFVGVGAARVRKLFVAAKKHAPCIIFIDELDAIGGRRVVNENQPHSRMTLNQLLIELDGFNQTEGVIVIGATNFPEILDKALTRPGRFDSKVHITMPDIKGRENILKLYLDKSQCSDDVDAEVIARATFGFSGADLSNLVNQAALRAASLQVPLITMEHFEWARDKIQMGPERKSAVIEKENQILTAYHEGGHAIVALYTKDALPVHKATIMPRGPALGFVMQVPEKEMHNWSRKQLLAKMDVCMGGRVAEEIIFGEDNVTTGASSDMEQASQIARAMVTVYGMSDKVGNVLIDEEGDKVSPELQSMIEGEVKRLIMEAYARAKALLNKYSKEHKMLAEALLKYETLDSNEIDLILKGLPLQR